MSMTALGSGCFLFFANDVTVFYSLFFPWYSYPYARCVSLMT